MPFIPKFDGSDSGPIDFQKAKKWIDNFKASTKDPFEIRSHYFGRDVIDTILLQQGCTGIRIYYALNDGGVKELLIVGSDDKGNNMLPAGPQLKAGDNIIADISYPCPSVCPGNDI